MKSKEQILQEYGLDEIPFDENITMYYPSVLNAMEAYAQQFAQPVAPQKGLTDEEAIQQALNHYHLGDVGERMELAMQMAIRLSRPSITEGELNELFGAYQSRLSLAYEGGGIGHVKFSDKIIISEAIPDLIAAILAKLGGQPAQPLPSGKEWAEWLHKNYEEIAEKNGWETQKATRVPFHELPFRNKATMLDLGGRLRSEIERRQKGGGE